MMHIQGAAKKSNPVVFCKFLSNRVEFFDETLQLYYLFISTYNCQISFNYLEIWQSYVISNTTTPRFWRGEKYLLIVKLAFISITLLMYVTGWPLCLESGWKSLKRYFQVSRLRKLPWKWIWFLKVLKLSLRGLWKSLNSKGVNNSSFCEKWYRYQSMQYSEYQYN